MPSARRLQFTAHGWAASQWRAAREIANPVVAIEDAVEFQPQQPLGKPFRIQASCAGRMPVPRAAAHRARSAAICSARA